VPDATALELIGQELGDAVLDTSFFRERATLEVSPQSIRAVLGHLRVKGYAHMASLHGVDYYPEEPRLGVQYELLSMEDLDRITVKLRVPTDAARVESVTPDWPTANHQEREVFDMFGVVFDGHPALTRILMPDDWDGHPQRKDYPLGGIPVEYKGAEIPPPDERRSYS
jgi:NADH-quinone oxidoreductase subunit C